MTTAVSQCGMSVLCRKIKDKVQDETMERVSRRVEKMVTSRFDTGFLVEVRGSYPFYRPCRLDSNFELPVVLWRGDGFVRRSEQE